MSSTRGWTSTTGLGVDAGRPVTGQAGGMRRNGSFYRHLVASLAVQVGVIELAAAGGSIAVWAWVVLLLLCLSLATHAAISFAPATDD